MRVWFTDRTVISYKKHYNIKQKIMLNVTFILQGRRIRGDGVLHLETSVYFG